MDYRWIGRASLKYVTNTLENVADEVIRRYLETLSSHFVIISSLFMIIMILFNQATPGKNHWSNNETISNKFGMKVLNKQLENTLRPYQTTVAKWRLNKQNRKSLGQIQQQTATKNLEYWISNLSIYSVNVSLYVSLLSPWREATIFHKLLFNIYYRKFRKLINLSAMGTPTPRDRILSSVHLELGYSKKNLVGYS